MSTPTPPEWQATPDDVAALLRARTKDDTGRELGVWSDETRPTADDVQTLIDIAEREIVGVDGPAAACAGVCRAAIAYRAACLVELSYFPEQVRSDRSPYEELKLLADEGKLALDECVSAGGIDGGAGTGEGGRYHSLPIDSETTALYYEGGGYGWRSPEYPASWRHACIPPTPSDPALIVEPEPPPLPLPDVVIGYPAEGDPEHGLPPIISNPDET